MEMHFPERILHFCDRADPRVATNIHHDSDGIRNDLAERGIEPVIPPRSNRKTPIEYDREVYKRRNLIERCVNRLKQFRRIATRYEKPPELILPFNAMHRSSETLDQNRQHGLVQEVS